MRALLEELSRPIHWQRMFFKRWSRDYTNEECDLPQGHKDCICTVDLLPEDLQHRTEADDDSMLATNWLEYTGELHPLLDILFGKGTLKRFSMGDLHTEY